MTLQMTVMHILRTQKQSPKRGLLTERYREASQSYGLDAEALIKTYTIVVAKKHGQYTNSEVMYPE